jgi:hypothetical protein
MFNFCVITNHEAILTTLSHIKKTEKHNLQWRLNRNWEILHSINYNQGIHDFEWKLGCDDEPLHQAALSIANSCILEYKVNQRNLAARQQPTIAYGLAYLFHGGTIINKKYDEEIAHYHNWEKFIKHCCEKFLWSTHTFHSVNWKVFQHQGKNWTSTGGPTFSNMCMNGYQSGKPYYKLTTPHLQYACHAPTSPKHTIISSAAPIFTASKSQQNV